MDHLILFAQVAMALVVVTLMGTNRATRSQRLAVASLLALTSVALLLSVL